MDAQRFLELFAPRAATLDEHLGAPWLAAHDGTGAQAVAERRIARWQQACNRFEPEGFAKRVHWKFPSGAPALAQRLGPKTLVSPQGVPAWMAQAWHFVSELCAQPPRDVEVAREPMPFEDLFTGFAARESHRLRETLSAAQAGCFANGCFRALERQLVVDLAEVFGYALEHEFSLFRVNHPQREASGGPERLYREFIARLRAGELFAFAIKYAALTRLACQARSQWRDHAAKLLTRFAQDREALAGWLGVAPQGLRVEALHCALSDRHQGGQSVVRLQLSQGGAIYYKCRAMALEHAMGELLEHVSGPAGADVPGLAALLPRVLPRGDHGWAQGVTAAAPELSRYYAAAGGGLAASWVLGATDLHDENVLMAAAGPAIVDAEMFASPKPRRFGGSAVSDLNVAELDTVLRCGLLPHWQTFGDGRRLQVNGLGGTRVAALGVKAVAWEHVNTDRMARRMLEVEAHDIPVTDVPAHEPADFEAEIIAGFEQGCAALARALGGEGAWPRWRERLSRLPVRFLFRDTRVYAMLRQRLLDPRHAQHVLDFELEIEQLVSTLVIDDAFPQLQALFEAEKKAILQGDVPYFLARTDSVHWQPGADTGDAQGALALFSVSGVDVIAQNIAGLTSERLAFQASLIRATLFASRPPGGPDNPAGEARGMAAPAVHGTGGTDPMAAAQRIGEQLLASAIRGRTGSIDDLSWIAPQMAGRDGCMNVRSLGCSLYDGRAGVGLFLAALARYGAQPRFEAAARAVFEPILQGTYLARRTEDLDGVRGGQVGRASLLYGLHAAGVLLREPRWVEVARREARRCSAADIAENPCADWISGLSGELAALRSVLGALPRDRLDAGLLRLVELRRDAGAPGGGWWPAPDMPEGLAGAGHGVAGIVQALVRLYPGNEAAGACLDAALRSLHARWQPRRAGWLPSAGNEAGGALPDTWAHGSVGIVMMTQGIDAGREAHRVQGRSEALARLRTAPLSDWDTLATGNCGAIDMFLSLGEHDLALQRAHAMLARAGADGDFHIPGHRLLRPGLCDGLAGVGYTLLRLLHPEALPCVLLLEPIDEGL
ncbi:type 2 lantibiotic biosynthesis protein LanM [Variovorax sp. OK605]|uniref:type 2 lanthipeptide synthetase LanM n=1 Tax=Variovorax sp. OK605 TaxID=1855317 RepID=UPI0008EE7A5E|nr:type 2 lanthipeptide synthetase LanM [Variovorax sp. OK605]SFQ08555.1 type 2 lantibiotic biosynthesis protein LanM [Variovorax sp. OK605]